MQVKRRFFIGDDWLYYKIYSGPKKAEEILLYQIYEIANDLYSAEKIKKFFFLRYYDEGYHIRLRFLVTDRRYIYDIIEIFNRQFSGQIESRVIWKIALDTYNREIERYGKYSIEHIESLFSRHSWECLLILREFGGDDNSRWLYCMKYFDMVLNQFNLSASEKLNFCERCYGNSIPDTPNNKPIIVSLDKKYREYAKEIDKYIVSRDIEGFLINHSWHAETAEYTVKQILATIDQYEEVTVFEMLNSITHMSFNRFFRTKQPKNELVIYYLMARYYKSLIAREKYAKAQA